MDAFLPRRCCHHPNWSIWALHFSFAEPRFILTGSDILCFDGDGFVKPTVHPVAEHSPSSFPKTFGIVTGALSLLSLGVLWGTAIPLGVPTEWVWERLPADAQSIPNLVLAGFAAAVYLLFVWLGDRRLSRLTVSSHEVALWLTGLAVAGFGWLWIVQDTAPMEGQLGKAPFVLYYPGSSGYFTQARYESPSPMALLRGYEALMQRGNVLHEGTHPPGLILVFQALIALVEQQPWLMAALPASEPESVHDALDVIAENAARTEHPLLPVDRAVLWLATLLTLITTAMTVWPLFSLLRVTLDRSAAWIGAAVWPAVPAVAIFLPKSDAVFPVMACAALVALGWSYRQRSFWRGAIAGGVLFVGLFCSLAFLPIMLFGALGVLTLSLRRTGWKAGLLELWPTIIGVAVGLIVPVILLRITCGINMLTVWGWNYHNHAGFYGQFTRTYWKWLLINPVELGVAVGIPVAVAAVWGLPRHARLRERTTADWLTVVATLVWGLLWLSGKNAGEAARLWILLMPGVVWIAAQHLQSLPRYWRWIWLAVQLAVSILTVHRVAGFHLG